MGVDDAGQHEQPGGVDLLARVARQLGLQRGDPAIDHATSRRTARHRRRPAPPRMSRSKLIVAHRVAQPADEGVQHVERDATSASATDSSGWWLSPPAQRTKSIATPAERRERHPVVAGAAGQPHHRQPGPPRGRRQPLGQRARRPRPPALSSRSRHATSTPRAARDRLRRAAQRRHGAVRAPRRRRGARRARRSPRPARRSAPPAAPPAARPSPPGPSVSRAARLDRPAPLRRRAARRRGARPSAPCPRGRPGPVNRTSARVAPAIALTTPTGASRPSSTGPARCGPRVAEQALAAPRRAAARARRVRSPPNARSASPSSRRRRRARPAARARSSRPPRGCRGRRCRSAGPPRR